MLRGIEKLERELRRIRRPRSTTITPTQGGLPVQVTVGDIAEFWYEGELRKVRVLAVMPWGVRGRDIDKEATRSFRFSKFGVADEGTPAAQETGEAALG